MSSISRRRATAAEPMATSSQAAASAYATVGAAGTAAAGATVLQLASQPSAAGAAAAGAAAAQLAPQPSATGASATGTAAARHLLEVTGLRCGYGRKNTVEIVHGASLVLDVDEFVCIIGANGCGKTTLLKAVMGLLPAISGEIRVKGVSIASMNERERAQRFAYIPQAHTPPFPFVVADVVLMGRTPYINRLARTTETDRLVAYQALELLGITHLADVAYTRLSGGQQQLVLIARALAQEADILVMDEPTASLDFGNQQLVLSRMRKLSRMGKAVVMVTHDPDHALMCADRVIVMEEGTVIATGPPADCISSDMMQRIYRTAVCVLDVPVGEHRSERVCVPLLD